MADTNRLGRIQVNRRTKLNGRRTALPNVDPLSCVSVPSQSCGLVPTGQDNLTKQQRNKIESYRQRQMNDMPELLIKSIMVSTWSPEDLEREAVVHVTKEDTYGSGTVNDSAMGTTERDVPCETCGTGVCAGHWGYIKLACPIYHPFFLTPLANVLTCICSSCGELLPTKEEIEALNLHLYSAKGRFKVLAEFCTKSQSKCRTNNCSDTPRVYTATAKSDNRDKFNIISWSHKFGKDKQKYPLNPTDALKILHNFERANPDQKDFLYSDQPELIGFLRKQDGSYFSKPSDWVMQNFPIMPPINRPPMEVNGVSRADNLSIIYVQVVKLNNALKNISAGGRCNRTKDAKDKYNTLKFSLVHILSNTDGKMKQPTKFECFTSRIKGKGGAIRNFNLGKRTNQNARTVANPEPSNKFGEVLVPLLMASILTYPEKVNQINRDYLQDLLVNDKVVKYVPGSGEMAGKMFSITESMKRALKLQIGDICHRHLQNGDYVLVNRQPTLHRQGMMGHRVVLSESMETKIFGLHLSATTALNADFDGDELNIHVPQTLEGVAEAMTFANASACIMHEATNKTIAGLVFDNLVAVTKLTTDGVILTQAQFFDLMLGAYPESDNNFSLEDHKVKMKQYGVPLYSGRSAFSMLLPDNFYYTKGDVIIRDGVLLQGVLTKADVGNSHRSIIQSLYHWSGNDYTVPSNFITRASFMLVRYMMMDPTTIGLGDCFPKDRGEHQRYIDTQIAHMKKAVIALGGSERMTPAEEQRLEAEIVARVNIPANKISKMIMDKMEPTNSFLLSIKSGAKGDKHNLQQISGILGQQLFYGKRPKWHHAYFQDDDPDPEARAFIINSFLQGLRPDQFWFHAAVSRIGVLDTATKVSSTGATQRRLMKFLESVKTRDDGTVTNSGGLIIQYVYGNDGFNAAQMISQPSTVDTLVSFIDLNNTVSELNAKYGYI